MDWKKEAAEVLREYPAQEFTMERIMEQLDRLEENITGVRVAAFTGVSVVGSKENHQEDRLVNAIAKKEELEEKLKSVRAWMATVDKALEMLSPEERRILDLLNIHRARGNAERLCDELHIEKSRLYDLRDQAFRMFTLSMYGCLDT